MSKLQAYKSSQIHIVQLILQTKAAKSWPYIDDQPIFSA